VRKALVSGLFAVVTLALGASTSSSAPSSTPRSVREAVARCDAEDKALDLLLLRAKIDPHFEAIYTYETYDAEAMNDPNRKVVIDKGERSSKAPAAVSLFDLVINTDNETPPDAREAAAAKIVSDQAVGHDPFLNPVRTSRQQNSARSKFCTQRVVKFLTSKDSVSRTLAQRVLLGLWQGVPDEDIKGYDARNASTWPKGRDAWLKYLSKQ
jgi:hypothetical protein